jgi:nicotinamidase-related amidase
MHMNCKLYWELQKSCIVLTIYSRAYHTTMLKDTTAGFTTEQKDAATELIWPLFANKVTTVREWVEGLGETM